MGSVEHVELKGAGIAIFNSVYHRVRKQRSDGKNINML